MTVVKTSARHPPLLSLLNGLVPPKGAANQKRRDHVIAFAERSGTATSSLGCSRVSQLRSRVPFWRCWDVGQARGLLLSDHAGAPGLTHQSLGCWRSPRLGGLHERI
jgi:hypothetical protein